MKGSNNMGEPTYYTDEEVEEIVFKIGDVLMDLTLGTKLLDDKYRTAYFLLQTAHSMFSDILPDEKEQSNV